MAEFDAHKVENRDEALPDDALGAEQLDNVSGGFASATENAEMPAADHSVS
jgi:hypothetical protein